MANALKSVKVAEFRNTYDALFRQANAHYHACVGVREVQGWKSIAARVLAEAEGVACNRASDYDKDQMASAIDVLTRTLEAADLRIAQIEAENTERANAHAAAAKPVLHVIQGGRLH